MNIEVDLMGHVYALISLVIVSSVVISILVFNMETQRINRLGKRERVNVTIRVQVVDNPSK